MQTAALIRSFAHSASHSNAPSMVSRILQARTLARQRKALAQLDETRLNDLGLTRADVAKETSLTVWDVPQGWRA